MMTERLAETLVGLSVMLLRTHPGRRNPEPPPLCVWQEDNTIFACWADDTTKRLELLPFILRQTIRFGEFRSPDEAMLIARTLTSLLCLGKLTLDAVCTANHD